MTDGRNGIPRRTLSRAEGDRLIVAYYFAQRHRSENMRRRCRMAIYRARGE